jgi:hypothetical protein
MFVPRAIKRMVRDRLMPDDDCLKSNMTGNKYEAKPQTFAWIEVSTPSAADSHHPEGAPISLEAAPGAASRSFLYN